MSNPQTNKAEAEEWQQRKDFLKETAAKIEAINPCSQDFYNLQWIYQNRDKILRNQKLINLIG